jgi:hypothetical protein
MIVLQIADPSGGRRIVHVGSEKARIGRHRDCDVRLDHETISKYHAEIVREGQIFLLRDLGSYNGTYLNDRWVTATPLKTGDTFRLGRFALTFLTPEDRLNPPPPPPGPLPHDDAKPHRSKQALLLVAAGLLAVCALQAAILIYVLSQNPPPAPGPQDTVGHGSPGTSPPEAETEAAARTQTPRRREPAKAPTSVGEAATPGEGPREGHPAQPYARRGSLLRPAWLGSFRGEAEAILTGRCFGCHDGSSGTRFLLFDSAHEPLRLRLNALALLPFLTVQGGDPPFLITHAASPAHGGGVVLGDEHRQTLDRFLSTPGFAAFREGVRTEFWDERPPFTVGEVDVSPEAEILLRRLYLDLLKRPPTDEELEQQGKWRPREVVQSLAKEDEFRALWHENPGQIFKELWDRKTATGQDAIDQLSALYAKNLAGRPPRRKDGRQRAASLFVDLWNRRPSEGERALVKNALKALDHHAGALPIAAFLLGAVEKPRSPERWVTRVFVRFLRRKPTPEESEETAALVEREGGLRGLLLGLATSHAYEQY